MVFQSLFTNSTPPNFTGRSRGAIAPQPVLPRKVTDPSRAEEAASNVVVDSSGTSEFDKILGIAGNLLKPTVGVVDNAITNKIKNELTDEVNTIRDEFGVGDAATLESGVEHLPLPRELEESSKNLGRLTQAYQQGRVSNSTYWARLESVVRQMKARFPGHRDQVDVIVSKLTGSTPANALRRALASEAASSQSSASKAEKEKIKLMTQLGAFSTPQELKDFNDGVTNKFEFIAPALQRKQEKEYIAAQKAKLEYNKSKGEVDLEELRKTATHEVFTELKQNPAMISLLKNLEEEANDLESMLAKNGRITETERKEAEALFRQFRSEFGKITDKILLDPSYASMKEADRQNIRETVNNYLANTEKDLTDANLGRLTANTRLLKTAIESGNIDMLTRHPFIRRAAEMRELIGSDTFVKVVTQRGKLGEFTKQVQDALVFKTITNDKPNTSLDADAKELSKTTTDNRAFTELENKYFTILAGKDNQLIARRRAFDQIYGDNNLNYLRSLPNSKKLDTYLTFTSNKATDVIMELENEASGLSTQYLKWSGKSFLTLFQGVASDVQTGITARENIKIDFDPNTNTFSVSEVTPVNNEQGTARLVRAIENRVEDSIGAQATKSVNIINNAIRNLTNIYQRVYPELGPEKAREQVRALIAGVGINPDAEREPTVLRSFIDAARRTGTQSTVGQQRSSQQEVPEFRDSSQQLDELLFGDAFF